MRKLGLPALRSIGDVSRLQRIRDNDADLVMPEHMLNELADDNRQLASEVRATHRLCEESNDIATAGLLETYLDERERRCWFLREATGEA